MDSLKTASSGKFGAAEAAPMKTFGGAQNLEQGAFGQASNFGASSGGLGNNLGSTGLGGNNLGGGQSAQQGGLWGQQGLGQQGMGGTSGDVLRSGTSQNAFLDSRGERTQFTENLGQQQGLSGQRWGGQQMGGLTQGVCAPNVASYERAPILQQFLHPSRVEEVQPIIHRQHEHTQIKQVIAPIHQREERAPIITARQLPQQTRPVVYNAPTQEFNTRYSAGLPTAATCNLPMQTQRVFKTPIIQDVVKTNIVEEIYPVVHRDVYQPEIIQQTLPVFERVVEPPTLLREERAPFILGSCPPVNIGLGQRFVDLDVKKTM